MAQYNYNRYQIQRTWGNETSQINHESIGSYVPIGSGATWDENKYVAIPTSNEGWRNTLYKISNGETECNYKTGSYNGGTGYNISTYTRKVTSEQAGIILGTVVAEDGAYPINGRHTDGYWYVRGSVYTPPVTKPSTPGTITVTGLISIGSLLTINWGASTGSGVAYTLQVSLNGGSWSDVQTSISGTSFNYTIPTGASNLTFRVVGINSGGSSSYSTSTIYTVTSLAQGVVVPQPYLTGGNGGRKIARLNNGWIVVATKTTNYFHFYVDKKDGLGFKRLCWSFSAVIGNNDISIVASGNKIYALTGWSTNYIRSYVIDVETQTDANIDGTNYAQVDAGQIAIGNISIEIDPLTGHLHAAWSSKNVTYLNSFNIRYAKSTDGGITWSTPINITMTNTVNVGFSKPTIVINDGKPTIIMEYTQAGANAIVVYKPDNRLESNTFTPSSGFYNKTIYKGATYTQTSPSAVVDKDGVIHIVWTGADATSGTYTLLKYSKSTDGGVTWSEPIQVSQKGKHADNPSITVDKKGKIVILYDAVSDNASNPFSQALQAEKDGETFKITELTNITSSGLNGGYRNPSTLYDNSFKGSFGATPPSIYSDGYNVKYIGTYLINTAPTINGSDTNLGDKTTPFTQNYSINDGDTSDNLTVIEKFNGTVLRTINNAPKDTLLTVDINSTLFTPLSLNSVNTITIEANDGNGGIAYRNYTFTKSNSAPIISGANADLGVISVIPSQVYQVSDNEGDAVTITEKIDDVVIRTFEATASTDYTVTIPSLEWFKLNLGQHILQVEALDSRGGKSIRTYTFTRADDKIKIELKTPFVTDIKASKILVSPTWVIPAGSTAKVEACNNAYDDVPSWEDITSQVKINRHYNFTNAVKTAAQWGINIRFTLEKGTATSQVILDGFGGAFE